MKIISIITDKLQFYIVKHSLVKLEKKIENLKNNTYSDFSEFEKCYLDIINEGTCLRKKVLETSTCWDKNSLSVLNNETHDLSLLSKDLKCFEKLFEIKKILVTRYQIYLKSLIDECNYIDAIKICERIYNLTGNSIFILSISDIYLKKLRQPDQSLKILKSAEPQMSKIALYWWTLADVYMAFKNYYNQVLCMQKAIEIETEGKNV